MNKKYRILFLIVPLSIVFYTIDMFKPDKELIRTNTESEENLTNLIESEFVKKDNKKDTIENITVDKEFSAVLNAKFMRVYDYNNKSSVYYEIEGLRNRNKTINDKETINQIEKYLYNIEKYPFQARDLISDCINIRGHRDFNIGVDKLKYKKNIHNAYYYYQTLTPYCDNFKGGNHPFWVILNMARNGDSLMQLELLRSLYMAIQAGVINPLQTPIKYMQIRDEAVNYLKILARKGVFEAAAQLNIQYNSGVEDKAGMLEKDLLQAYYYGYLADKYDTFNWRGLVDGSISDIYSEMTEYQQKKADKIVSNL